ncbi:MAG: FAD-binding oxidoreductase, partial [Candidatus Tectomicrobia bacterium]|nr:FAD-binding oxidoreductase [Candidatus Tectomicrobia bacterium]
MAESWSRERPLRWWGWGYLDQHYDLEGREAFLPFLAERLALAGLEPLPTPPTFDLSHIDLPAPRVAPGLLKSLEELVGWENLSIGHESRLTHALGKGYCDLVRLRQGRIAHPPDLVVYPQDERQVGEILLLAEQERYAVIPFGGGTSVVGGVEPVAARGLQGAISLDLRRMDQLLEVDGTSRIATIQAGIRGPALEAALARQGYTLGHFPQSFEFSTLGGWIATRSAGQQSTRYGKIEEMVVSLRIFTPRGPLETRKVPASASGPSLKALWVGSEGTYGIITQASLTIHPQPARRDYQGLWFRSFSEGLTAIREIIQRGLRPATVRLSDPEETQATVALRRLPTGFKALKERLGRWLLRLKGYPLTSGCLLILGFEGEEMAVERGMQAALEICVRHGGYPLGERPGQAWYRERFALPYLRDLFLDWGLMVDTV